MQKIKLALKVFNSKSKIEKILVKIANDSTSELSREKQVAPIIQRFQELDNNEEARNCADEITEFLRNCKGWAPALKLLYVSHELIDNVGSNFCQSFLSEYFDKISNLETHNKHDVETHVHSILAANYYNFLIIYAKYFPDIQAHLLKDPRQLTKQLQQEEYQSLVQLVSFKNVVKYFVKVEECIEGSASVLKDHGLISKISLLLFRDVIMIYNLLSKVLQATMSCIFEINSGLAILLDELYSDMVQVTNKLRNLVSKSKLVSSIQIPVVNYFEFDPDFNQQEELYILELKKKKAKQIDKSEPYQSYLHQYQTLAPGKKMYRFNTAANGLTKVSDNHHHHHHNHKNHDDKKNYFFLASPEPSQFEEESGAPFKNNEQDEISFPQGKFILQDAEPDKDHVKLEIRLDYEKYGKNKYALHGRSESNFFQQDEDHVKMPESLIFTPTSTKQFEDENTGESLPKNKFTFESALQKRMNKNL